MKINFHIKNKKINRLYFYPIFLIIFILFTLYSFIFGENGFYSHKKKVETISLVEKKNQIISSKISALKNKVSNIKSQNPFTIEREARLIPLKKSGDIIIKLYHKKWIEDLGNKLETQNKPNTADDNTQESFLGHYKVVIGILISLLIAFILTFILPKMSKTY
ncbi:MAG: septum formation initiator family protein [Spirochaetota bacterium]|nr:septum formation initiator family protein [Spirochaetota bacterium]